MHLSAPPGLRFIRGGSSALCHILRSGALRGWLFAMFLLAIQFPLSAELVVVSAPADTNSASPDTLSLGWSPTISSEATGYYLDYGFASGSRPNRLEVGNVTAVTVGGFQTNVTYYLTVVAHDAVGNESPPSNEVEVALPSLPGSTNASVQLSAAPQSEGGLKLTFSGNVGASYDIQATEDFQNWMTIGTTNCIVEGPIVFDYADMADYPRRFFRIVKNN